MSDIHSEANDIINRQPEAARQMLNDLRNYFYAVTRTVELHEYSGGVTRDMIMGPICSSLDFAHSASVFADMLMKDFAKAGMSDKARLIGNTALEAIDDVVSARLKGGKISGHGHHIRQEMSSKAIVAVAKALNLNA